MIINFSLNTTQQFQTRMVVKIAFFWSEKRQKRHIPQAKTMAISAKTALVAG
jgi:hypothetical protein